MPQMAPLNWLMLFFYFMIIFILFNIFSYFLTKYFFTTINSKKKSINFFWKW